MQVIHGYMGQTYVLWNNAAKLEYNSNKINISLYGSCDHLYLYQEQVSYTGQVTLNESLFNNKDLIIVRHKVNNATYTYDSVHDILNLDTINDLMFVIKGIKGANISDNKVVISINHYQVK